MSKITTFTGTEASHGTNYSIQRMFLYWPVSGLTGRVKSVTLSVTLRTAATISNKGFKLCLFTDRNALTNWSVYNGHCVYQYPSSSGDYFNEANYSRFSSNFLCNKDVSVSVTGGAGNVSTSFTVGIDSAYSNVALWNGKDVLLGFYETGGESSGLIWGTSQIAVLTVETSNGIVKYATNGGFVNCEVYFATGGSWQQVQPYFATGGAFKEIGE